MVRGNLSCGTRNVSPWEVFAPWGLSERRVRSLLGDLVPDQSDTPTAFVPRTNVAETDEQYEVTLDLPGLKAENVQIEFQDDTLAVFGEHQEVAEEKGKKFHRVERTSGKFHRLVTLPDAVNGDKISAEFSEGVLTVTLPKSEAVKPKQIEIKAK